MSEIWRSPVDNPPPQATIAGRYDLITHTITVIYQVPVGPVQAMGPGYLPVEVSSEVARGFGEWLIKCANRKDDHDGS